MYEVARLSVTSFRGAMGGEHYYGRLHVDGRYVRTVEPDGTVRLRGRSGHGVERHPADGLDLTRTLGAKEAAYLNEKDGTRMDSSIRLKSGSSTTRFNDVDSIVEAAISAFGEMFDETDVLMYERRRNSDVWEILAAPDKVREGLNGIADLWEQEKWFMDNGYLLVTDEESS